jgi:hypothetical protein
MNPRRLAQKAQYPILSPFSGERAGSHDSQPASFIGSESQHSRKPAVSNIEVDLRFRIPAQRWKTTAFNPSRSN